MRYGFVIDQNRCIGCHACTVACKEEHNIPLGVNRTWVKYIEKGDFPETRRHFAVLRCNHCDAAPCIEICPTVALFRRKDGIVDFDSERCIGCKSCMQACPYDALYIDPSQNTAAKCNFDASRVERGYKPACEVVCPTQAILSGDLDDPNSAVNRIVAGQKVSVRKPGKGTQPKLFYVGVDGNLLNPTMMEPQLAHFWAEKQPGEDLYALASERKNGHFPEAAREVYDIPHPPLWGNKIVAYLWSKSIAAGVLLVAALLLRLGYRDNSLLLSALSPLLALIFLWITMIFLVFDLKRPDRFYYLLTKPNSRSWLVIGGYILIAYGGLAVVWLLSGAVTGSIPTLLSWSTAFLAVGAACYTAFLFGQAKGRDLWQSPLFLWHLLIQAATAGAATLILFGALLGVNIGLLSGLARVLTGSLIVTLVMIMGEIFQIHVSEDARRATDLLKQGALSGNFWSMVIILGIMAPLFLLFWGAGLSVAYVAAAVLALVGLWFYDDLWIKAGQAVPLS